MSTLHKDSLEKYLLFGLDPPSSTWNNCESSLNNIYLIDSGLSNFNTVFLGGNYTKGAADTKSMQRDHVEGKLWA